jgi:hypothetical protein
MISKPEAGQCYVFNKTGHFFNSYNALKHLIANFYIKQVLKNDVTTAHQIGLRTCI